MKKILILGGSYLQSGFIETAVSHNHEVHVLDRNPYCYAIQIAGIKFKDIDLSDKSAVEDYFLSHQFDTVIGPVTELGNRTAAYLGSKYGFLYNSLKTVDATTNKNVMRKVLMDTNLNAPIFKQFESIEDILRNFSFPLIIKPSISSASRGVTLVRQKNELESAIEEALKYCSSPSEVLVEEYIEGEQFSIETVSSFGNHFIVGITKEIISGPPYFMERTDIVSKEIHEKYSEQFSEYINILLSALDIKVGPCHTEVKVRDGKIYLIEVASRSGLLRDKILETSQSSNYNELILRSYLGEKLIQADFKSPGSNALLGVIMTPEDLKIYLHAKSKNKLYSDYFFGKGPVIHPKQLVDAFGYFFICSQEDVSEFIL